MGYETESSVPKQNKRVKIGAGDQDVGYNKVWEGVCEAFLCQDWFLEVKIISLTLTLS